VKIAQPTLYCNWDEYMEAFCEHAGVIEAAPPSFNVNQVMSPSVSFFIEPDSQIKLIGSFDKFCGSDFINAGCFFPQTSLPQIDLLKVCNSVGTVLYEKGVMGHVTIDLISFPNPEDPDAHPLFQAIDISTELTNQAAIVLFFDILMEGKLEQQTGEYSISWTREEEAAGSGDEQSDKKDEINSDLDAKASAGKKMQVYHEPRGFMYADFLHHPGLQNIQYKTFFHMCRLEGISFDMESRSGSTFCLFDGLSSGVIGMLTIGVHRRAAV